MERPFRYPAALLRGSSLFDGHLRILDIVCAILYRLLYCSRIALELQG